MTNPPSSEPTSFWKLFENLIKAASSITTPASFAALVIILFCVLVLMLSDLGAARPWLTGLLPLAGICMLAALSRQGRPEHQVHGRATLDDHLTKQFLDLYQRALAYYISREIDVILDSLRLNPESYDRKFFSDRIWAVTLECRLRATGFRNERIGDFSDYFSARFPETALRSLIVETYEPILLDLALDPIIKRQRLFATIENIQRRFFTELEREISGTDPRQVAPRAR